VLFASNSFATSLTDTATAVNNVSVAEGPLDVKYLGEDGDYLLFEVAIKSVDHQTSSFVLTDKKEGEIYSAKFSKNKVQTIKIEKTGNQELDFTLMVGNEKFSKSFNVQPTVILTTIVSNK
jgi:hypothetical protein